MANPRAFGRRSAPAQSLPEPVRPRAAAAIISKKSVPAPAPATTELSEDDEELRQWQQARKQGIRLPWRLWSLIAGLCFGIASLVLPDEVNDTLQWPLYALTAASLIAGLQGRRRAAKIPSQPDNPEKDGP